MSIIRVHEPDQVHDMHSYKAAITVFLALIFVSVSALVLTLVESARTAGLKYHLEAAADSALDSVFSEYHNELWDRYRIHGYECSDTASAEAEMNSYMETYARVESWMRMDGIKAVNADAAYLTDGGGEWLEQEIVDYMNFGIAENLINIDAADRLDQLRKDLKEADAIQEITNDYAGKTKEALMVEQALTDISRALEELKELKDKAEESLHHGSNGSFQHYTDQMISEIEKTAGEEDGGLVCVYLDGSYELEEELDRIDQEHARSYSNISSSEGREIVNSVKADYIGYSSEEKSRRTEIEEIYSQLRDDVRAIERSREAADEIEEFEMELAAAADEDDDYDYEAEIQDLWDELAESFSMINIPGLDFEYGVADEQKKGFLEKAKELLSGDLLVLILPEGKTVSQAKLALSDAPSHTAGNSNRSKENRTVIENVLIAEYIARYFSEFTDDTDGPVRYEMEYICAGLDTDRKNLASAAGDVFVIREGMNYLSIVRDGNKRSQARHLAEEIVIGASAGTLTALVPVVECLIIAVWAGAESVVDCRALLDGRKVSLIKSSSEWKLDVHSILSWGENRKLEGSDSGDDKGLDYENYLKFIILLLFGEDRNFRMMDIMQINVWLKDDGFLIKDCVYGLDMEVTGYVQHLFTAIPVISSETGGFTRSFEIKTEALKAY